MESLHVVILVPDGKLIILRLSHIVFLYLIFFLYLSLGKPLIRWSLFLDIFLYLIVIITKHWSVHRNLFSGELEIDGRKFYKEYCYIECYV